MELLVPWKEFLFPWFVEDAVLVVSSLEACIAVVCSRLSTLMFRKRGEKITERIFLVVVIWHSPWQNFQVAIGNPGLGTPMCLRAMDDLFFAALRLASGKRAPPPCGELACCFFACPASLPIFHPTKEMSLVDCHKSKTPQAIPR